MSSAAECEGLNVRSLPSEGRGREFESRRVHHIRQLIY